MKVVVDTGVFVGVLNKEKGYENSYEFLEKIRRKRIEGFISVMTVAEVISIYRRLGEEETIMAKINIESLIGEDRIVPITKQLAELAGKVKADFRVSLGDAFIIATAVSINCKYLVTLDPEIRAVSLIETKAPSEILSG